MKSLELEGYLHSKSNTQQISDRFKKREFVLRVLDGQHEQLIKLELHQDKVIQLDGLKKDDELLVRFNIRGKGYEKNGTTNYYTNLVAWKIERATAAPSTPTKQANENSDDLPF